MTEHSKKQSAHKNLYRMENGFKIKFVFFSVVFFYERGNDSEAESGEPQGRLPKHDSFSRQARRGLGRFWGQTGDLAAVCPGLGGETDWINSSLRASRSLRGHRGNVGWRRKVERGFKRLSQDHCLFVYSAAAP